MLRIVGLCLLLVIQTGCAAIIEGTSQDIAIGTIPAGARCELQRDGAVIGIIDPTPGRVTVEKNKQNIFVNCSKEGYQDTGKGNESDIAAATFANLILGGVIGLGVDAFTGAINKYDSQMSIQLVPADSSQAPPPADTGSQGINTAQEPSAKPSS